MIMRFSCKSPTKSFLSAYLFGNLFACILASLVTFYFYSTVNSTFVENSIAILRNAGFSPSKDDVHGSEMGTFRLQVFIFSSALTSITSNVIIVVSFVSKKQLINELRQEVQLSDQTKRMQRDLHRLVI